MLISNMKLIDGNSYGSWQRHRVALTLLTSHRLWVAGYQSEPSTRLDGKMVLCTASYDQQSSYRFLHHSQHGDQGTAVGKFGHEDHQDMHQHPSGTFGQKFALKGT